MEVVVVAETVSEHSRVDEETILVGAETTVSIKEVLSALSEEEAMVVLHQMAMEVRLTDTEALLMGMELLRLLAAMEVRRHRTDTDLVVSGTVQAVAVQSTSSLTTKLAVVVSLMRI